MRRRCCLYGSSRLRLSLDGHSIKSLHEKHLARLASCHYSLVGTISHKGLAFGLCPDLHCTISVFFGAPRDRTNVHEVGDHMPFANTSVHPRDRLREVGDAANVVDGRLCVKRKSRTFGRIPAVESSVLLNETV